jgi:hypothetical protein
MNEQYVAPELKLVGDTRDVVLGSGNFGADVWGEVLIPDFEFQQD